VSSIDLSRLSVSVSACNLDFRGLEAELGSPDGHLTSGGGVSESGTVLLDITRESSGALLGTVDLEVTLGGFSGEVTTVLLSFVADVRLSVTE